MTQPKKARIGAAEDAGLGMAHEIVDDLFGCHRRLRQGAAQVRAQLSERCSSCDGAGVEGVEVAGSVGSRQIEQAARVGHWASKAKTRRVQIREPRRPLAAPIDARHHQAVSSAAH